MFLIKTIWEYEVLFVLQKTDSYHEPCLKFLTIFVSTLNDIKIWLIVDGAIWILGLVQWWNSIQRSCQVGQAFLFLASLVQASYFFVMFKRETILYAYLIVLVPNMSLLMIFLKRATKLKESFGKLQGF